MTNTSQTLSTSKLKPVKSGLIFALIVISSIVSISLFFILDAILGEASQINSKGATWLVFALINLVIWILRKDLLSLSLILLCTTMSVSYLIDYKGVCITLPLIGILIFYGYLLYANHKFQANYRRILELAAKPVQNATDGFSTRPYPAGASTVNQEQLTTFARFAKRHFFAFPYEQPDGVMLALTDRSKFWFGRPNEIRDSYVLFRSDGGLVVNISKNDYKQYDKEYSFDELCASLGHLFTNFIIEHGRGNSNKILEQLRAVQ